MSDEKQDLKLYSPLHIAPLGFFRFLPKELILAIFNFISFEALAKFKQVNRFFVSLVYDATFFDFRGKCWIWEIFLSRQGKRNLTKEFLREQIYQQDPRKFSFSGFNLAFMRDWEAFPKKNIVLKQVRYNRSRYYHKDDYFISFYQTTLLNKLVFKVCAEVCAEELGNYIFTSEFAVKPPPFDFEIYHKNGIIINATEFDFVEHCILYYLNALPTDPKAKNTLRCFHQISPLSGPQYFFYYLALGIGCSDPTTVTEMINRLSSFKEEILISFLPVKYPTLIQDYGEQGTFTIGLSVKEVFIFFLTNPIHIALHLLNTPQYLIEEDFQDSCEILLEEIENFRGFSRFGVSDEALDGLKNQLQGAIHCAITAKNLLAQKNINTAGASTENSRVEEIFDELQQQDKEGKRGVQEYVQKNYTEIKIQTTIETIEQIFKDNFDNKLVCQAQFKQLINSPDLGVAQRARIFAHFKDRVELNRHRNPRFDNFFGIQNTTSWRETWKEIREEAKQKLFSEVQALPEAQKKQELLNWARNHPLFCDHRNNSVITAFGRTKAVQDIEANMSQAVRSIP